MAEFHFRLATLLKLRESERNERRLRLAEAREAERILGERIAELENEREDISRQSRDAVRPGPLNLDRVVQTSRFELLVEAQLRAMQDRNNQLQEELERRHEALVEADRGVRVLEKLRERWLADYQRQQLKLEQKELDALGLRQGQGQVQ